MITLLDWNSDRKKMKDETERFMFDGFGRILAILINDVEDSYKLKDDQLKEPETAKAQNLEAQQ